MINLDLIKNKEYNKTKDILDEYLSKIEELKTLEKRVNELKAQMQEVSQDNTYFYKNHKITLTHFQQVKKQLNSDKVKEFMKDRDVDYEQFVTTKEVTAFRVTVNKVEEETDLEKIKNAKENAK